MKLVNDIPKNFDELNNKNLIFDSDDISMSDLKQFDSLIEKYGLELVVFENGSAYNFYVSDKP